MVDGVSRAGMEPSGPDEVAQFASALPDEPFTFGARSLLQRGLGRLWLTGPASRPVAAVVLAPWVPAEPMAFGEDAEAIWNLLRGVPGWECVNLASRTASSLARVLERELGIPTQLYGDVYYLLDRDPARCEHPAVRRLTEDDLELVERSPSALHPVGYLSTLAALSGGVVVGGVVHDELVATVAMTVSSEEYADLGAHTLEAWRNRGIATAAASLTSREVLRRGLVPVWSTGEDNRGSQRVAEKVGFREFGRQSYVVVPALRSQGGYRPAPS